MNESFSVLSCELSVQREVRSSADSHRFPAERGSDGRKSGVRGAPTATLIWLDAGFRCENAERSIHCAGMTVGAGGRGGRRPRIGRRLLDGSARFRGEREAGLTPGTRVSVSDSDRLIGWCGARSRGLHSHHGAVRTTAASGKTRGLPSTTMARSYSLRHYHPLPCERAHGIPGGKDDWFGVEGFLEFFGEILFVRADFEHVLVEP